MATDLITLRGPDRRDAAGLIETPFVWFHGNSADGNKIKNYGNIGEDLEFFGRGTPGSPGAVELLLCNNEPWMAGQEISPFNPLRAHMPTVEPSGTENAEMMEMQRWMEVEDGSMLLFMSMIVVNHSYEEHFIWFGTGFETPVSNGLNFGLTVNNGQFAVRGRVRQGTSSNIVINLGAALPAAPLSPYNLLFHFNKDSEVLKMYVDGALHVALDVSTIFGAAVWGVRPGVSELDSIDNSQKALTLGESTTGNSSANAPGTRSTGIASAIMSASDMRDVMIFNTTGRTSTVDANLPAIASLLDRVPIGVFPTELSNYL